MDQSTVPHPFVERRNRNQVGGPSSGERRQFTNSHAELSPEAQELARAVDHYKLKHHRRYIDFQELLGVVESLGYHKTDIAPAG